MHPIRIILIFCTEKDCMRKLLLIHNMYSILSSHYELLFLLCARHGNCLGGESPLWGTHRPTIKEAQGAYREVGAEGSVE